MIVTVTNMKGGVGKTTTSSLLAKYIAINSASPVVLIDMDPQGGASSLFLGNQKGVTTVYDALDEAFENGDPSELMHGSLQKPFEDINLFVIASDKRLNQMGTNGATNDLLAYAIECADFAANATVVIDTGTMPNLVAMGIYAADKVLIPMTMSRQTVRPTAATLGMVIRGKKELLGIFPVAAGKAQWEEKTLEAWSDRLEQLPGLSQVVGKVLQGMPSSKAIIRGGWVSGVFPKKMTPIFDNIYKELFGESALPVVMEQQENAEVLNG